MEKKKTGKYFKYAIGEIILVVIGILIALQINNWNENQKRKSLEIKHLKELKSDIEKTLIDVGIDATQHKKNIQSNLYIQDFLFKKIKYHDSLAYHFFRIVEDYQLYPKTSALESIKSTGLDIISNDSLRLGITDFFQVTVKDAADHGRVSKGSNNFKTTLWPYLEKHFKLIDKPIKKDGAWYHIYIKHPPKQWEVIDATTLQNDNRLHLKINNTLMRRQGVISVLSLVSADGLKLIELIDAEISKLE